MFSMNDKNTINIMKIFKDASISFINSFNKDLKYGFNEKISDEKITVIFEFVYDRYLRYEFRIEKAKNNADKIPNISKYEKLDNSNTNPYKKLKFTDENYMLGYIYDKITKYSYKEIVCYNKIGIIVKNLMNMDGIYNINIRYIGDL